MAIGFLNFDLRQTEERAPSLISFRSRTLHNVSYIRIIERQTSASFEAQRIEISFWRSIREGCIPRTSTAILHSSISSSEFSHFLNVKRPEQSWKSYLGNKHLRIVRPAPRRRVKQLGKPLNLLNLNFEIKNQL